MSTARLTDRLDRAFIMTIGGAEVAHHYLNRINNSNWRWIGATDVNGDGDADQSLVNQAIGRFATIGGD